MTMLLLKNRSAKKQESGEKQEDAREWQNSFAAGFVISATELFWVLAATLTIFCPVTEVSLGILDRRLRGSWKESHGGIFSPGEICAGTLSSLRQLAASGGSAYYDTKRGTAFRLSPAPRVTRYRKKLSLKDR